jgi:hypothetical protein
MLNPGCDWRGMGCCGSHRDPDPRFTAGSKLNWDPFPLELSFPNKIHPRCQRQYVGSQRSTPCQDRTGDRGEAPAANLCVRRAFYAGSHPGPGARAADVGCALRGHLYRTDRKGPRERRVFGPQATRLPLLYPNISPVPPPHRTCAWNAPPCRSQTMSATEQCRCLALHRAGPTRTPIVVSLAAPCYRTRQRRRSAKVPRDAMNGRYAAPAVDSNALARVQFAVVRGLPSRVTTYGKPRSPGGHRTTLEQNEAIDKRCHRASGHSVPKDCCQSRSRLLHRPTRSRFRLTDRTIKSLVNAVPLGLSLASRLAAEKTRSLNRSAPRFHADSPPHPAMRLPRRSPNDRSRRVHSALHVAARVTPQVNRAVGIPCITRFVELRAASRSAVSSRWPTQTRKTCLGIAASSGVARNEGRRKRPRRGRWPPNAITCRVLPNWEEGR